MAPASTSAPVRWRAVLPNGLGHAFAPRTVVHPAICGVPNQAEMFDYPVRGKCGLCLQKLTRGEAK